MLRPTRRRLGAKRIFGYVSLITALLTLILLPLGKEGPLSIGKTTNLTDDRTREASSAQGPRGSLSPAMHASKPPPEGQAIDQLNHIMRDLRSALISEKMATRALDSFRVCIERGDKYPYRSLIAVCVHNAELIGRRFPTLKAKVRHVVSLAAARSPAGRFLPAPPAPAGGERSLPNDR